MLHCLVVCTGGYKGDMLNLPKISSEFCSEFYGISLSKGLAICEMGSNTIAWNITCCGVVTKTTFCVGVKEEVIWTLVVFAGIKM